MDDHDYEDSLDKEMGEITVSHLAATNYPPALGNVRQQKRGMFTLNRRAAKIHSVRRRTSGGSESATDTIRG